MLNKVMVIGRLVRDVDLRYTASGTAVANLTLALNRRRKGGEQETAFVDVVVWGDQAVNFDKFHSKGDKCYIEGRITQDSWESQSGEKRTKLKITCESWSFASDIAGGNQQKEENVQDTSQF
jgi:single-strand DNA-binding protein